MQTLEPVGVIKLVLPCVTYATFCLYAGSAGLTQCRSNTYGLHLSMYGGRATRRQRGILWTHVTSVARRANQLDPAWVGCLQPISSPKVPSRGSIHRKPSPPSTATRSNACARKSHHEAQVASCMRITPDATYREIPSLLASSICISFCFQFQSIQNTKFVDIYLCSPFGTISQWAMAQAAYGQLFSLH
jgi:hypothetical protein